MNALLIFNKRFSIGSFLYHKERVNDNNVINNNNYVLLHDTGFPFSKNGKVLFL